MFFPYTMSTLQEAFRSGHIDAKTALANVEDFLKDRTTKAAAERFVSEVLGMPAEPQKLSVEDKRAAKAWEKANRSK